MPIPRHRTGSTLRDATRWSWRERGRWAVSGLPLAGPAAISCLIVARAVLALDHVACHKMRRSHQSDRLVLNGRSATRPGRANPAALERVLYCSVSLRSRRPFIAPIKPLSNRIRFSEIASLLFPLVRVPRYGSPEGTPLSFRNPAKRCIARMCSFCTASKYTYCRSCHSILKHLSPIRSTLTSASATSAHGRLGRLFARRG